MREVNTTIKINEEIHNARFRFNISSKKECENLVNDTFEIPAFDGNPEDRVLTAGYFDINSCPMALDPVGNPDERRLTFCEFKPDSPRISPIFEFRDTLHSMNAKTTLEYLRAHQNPHYPLIPMEPSTLTTLKI